MQLFNTSSLVKRFIKGVSWSLFGKIISASATLTVYALLARLLTKDEMGAYFFTFSLVTFLSIFCQWGFNRGLVKLVAAGLARGRIKEVRSGILAAFGITIVLSVFIATILALPIGEKLLFAISDSELLISLTAIIGLWIIFKAMQGLVSEAFRGFHDIRLATIFGGMIPAVLSMGFYFIFWIYKGEASLNQVVQLMVLAAGLNLLIGFGFLLRKVYSLESGGKIRPLKIMKFGFPLCITSISLLGVKEFHLWVLVMFQSQSEVAMYGAAVRLVTLLTMPLIIVNSVIPPMIADLYTKKSYGQVQRIMQKTATLIGVPAIVVFCIVAFFGEEILELVYGQSYGVAYTSLFVLTCGQLVNVLTGSPGVLLTMSGHEKIVMGSALTSGLLGLVISYFGVQEYGAIGAAYGYSTSLVLVNLFMWFYSYRKISIKTHGSPIVLWRMLRKNRY